MTSNISSAADTDVLTAEKLKEAMAKIAATTSTFSTTMPNYTVGDFPSYVDDRIPSTITTDRTYRIGDNMNDYDYDYDSYKRLMDENNKYFYPATSAPAKEHDPNVRVEVDESNEVSGPLAELINGI